MAFHLFDVKTGEELNLPKITNFYKTTSLQKGVDLLKIFFNRKELRMKFIDYSECRRKGCVIISNSLKESWKPMFKRQTEYYELVHKKQLKTLSASYIIVDECPNKVKIKFDVLCNRIRIEGRGVNWGSKGYKGKWIFLEDFEDEKEEENEKF